MIDESRMEYAIDLLEKTSKMLDLINQRIDAIEQKISKVQGCDRSELIDAHQAGELLGIHPKTVERYRIAFWTEGIHFFRQAREYRYNALLLADWAKNRHSPQTHQRAIDVWVNQQMSNQPTRRRRAS